MAAVGFGPHQKMTLDAELLEVLTAGDKVRMEEILSRQDHGAGHQTDGQVAVNVHGAAPGRFLLGVASNGNTALHLVASRGHVELAALLCERAPSLAAARNKCLDTPLHCAARFGHADVAAVLLPRMLAGGAEGESALRARNQTGATALYEAVRHCRAGVVDLLMTEAPDLASVDGGGGISPLYLAASTHSVQMVRALLRPSENGTPSSASFSGPEGRTALHVAVTVSEVIVQAILGWQTQGPTLLTAVDSSGRTPLHFAALCRKFDIVKRLLDDHASLELASISDNSGSFPIHIAAMTGDTRTLYELIKKCPDYYELVDNQGRNLLHCAIKHGQDLVVRHICQNDKLAMLLNATDSEGNTPLHLAVECGNPRIVSLLLATLSVYMGITNKDGLTASDLCCIARAPRQSNYFLDPCIISSDCLWWLRAPCTLEGGIRAYDKLATKNPPEKQHSMTKSGTIASVLIATVAFAAAFTVPGGFVTDDHALAGTAILARHFAFRVFVVSDTMAFVCSVVATCFHIYGAAQTIPQNHRRRYNRLASGLVPIASQFMIAAFAFGFHLILGSANRWLIVLVYTLSLASLLSCFPSIWAPFHLGLGKAIWRRAGWRGLVNVHERPSSLRQFLRSFITSFLFENARRLLFVLLIAATFVVAIVLSIALPNY